MTYVTSWVLLLLLLLLVEEEELCGGDSGGCVGDGGGGGSGTPQRREIEVYISSVVSCSAFETVAVAGCEVQVLRPLWSLWKGMAEA